MTGPQILTLWSSDGATKAYEQATTRKILDAIKPQGVQIHTTPKALASPAGAALTARIRRDYPAVKVTWACAGDADDPAIPGYADHWPEMMRAALACGVSEVQLNCEGRWSTRPRGSMAAALRLAHAAAPSVVLTHTSFAGPVWLSKHRYGYGESYPWREALGADSPVARSAPQVYWGTPDGENLPRGRGPKAERLHEESWGIATRRGLIKPELVTDIYLQAYDCRVDELCAAADDEPHVYWWALPVRCDGAGVTAAAVLSELHRRGQTIREAQAALGLTADGLVGPMTCSAILGNLWRPPETML